MTDRGPRREEEGPPQVCSQCQGQTRATETRRGRREGDVGRGRRISDQVFERHRLPNIVIVFSTLHLRSRFHPRKKEVCELLRATFSLSLFSTMRASCFFCCSRFFFGSAKHHKRAQPLNPEYRTLTRSLVVHIHTHALVSLFFLSHTC